MQPSWILRALASISAISFAAHAQEDAETEPLWELGVAGGALYAPDYPASDENSPNGLALPYAIYRGDFFRIGDGGARGVFVDADRYEFDVSISGSFDASSDDNDARNGMPDLDFLGEIGPRLTIDLGAFQGGRWELELPLRAVFSTDFSDLEHQGFVFAPALSHRRDDVFGSVDLLVELTANFATEDLHDYFYEVAPVFATPARPAFDAEGGYLGSELTVGLAIPATDHLRLFVGGQLAFHGGAANEDSPLFREDLTLGVGAGFAWRLYESERRVPANRR